MRANARSRAFVRKPDASYALVAYSRLCESLDTPVSLSCWLMAKYGEWDQLVDRKIAADRYLDAGSFWPDYLAVSVLSKAEFLPTTYDRRETAVRKFWAAEKQCAETNQRLDAYAEGRLMPRSLDVHGALHRAREFIRRVLGPLPKADCILPYRFGPGATTLVKRYVNAAEKYRRQVDVTPALYPFWRDVCGPTWAKHVKSVSLRASNSVSFVPKNAKTFRAIAIEPHVNGYTQLGVASLLRQRLRLFGIDLDRQADVNRHMAELAWSLDLATIDLSSASDTVARSLVWLLLPEEWASLLDTIRSPYGVLDGVEFEYHKFSSMGNGCTFELETLIFFALAKACGSEDWATCVFGDDIIVETSVAERLMDVLSFCGFTVNEEKSFTCGPFRESCGRDFFQGEDVRPFFWKELDVPLWFKVPNDTRRLLSTRALSNRQRAAVKRVWLHTVDRMDSYLSSCRVPDGYGSFGLEDDRPAVVSDRHDRDGWCGFAFKGLIFTSRKVPCWADYQAMLHCLDGGSYEGTGNTSFRGFGTWKKSTLRAFGSWRAAG